MVRPYRGRQISYTPEKHDFYSIAINFFQTISDKKNIWRGPEIKLYVYLKSCISYIHQYRILLRYSDLRGTNFIDGTHSHTRVPCKFSTSSEDVGMKRNDSTAKLTIHGEL